jgi:hypothetical protein
MTKKKVVLAALTYASLLLLLSSTPLLAQSKDGSGNLPDTPNMPASQQHDHGATSSSAQPNSPKMDMQMAMQEQALSGGHDEMGPHMKMTSLRPIKPGDQERAATILRELGPAIEKYKDYKVALANGYRIFEPDVKAKSPQIHFNSTFGGGFTQG